VLSCTGQPGCAAVFSPFCSKNFPQRPIVVVVEDLKTQESFQQDMETCCKLQVASCSCPDAEKTSTFNLQLQLLFYPAWEVLPHEGKLPHAEPSATASNTRCTFNFQLSTLNLVVTSITALLQKPFRRVNSKTHAQAATRRQIAPLDLMNGSKSMLTTERRSPRKANRLRGGIVDVWPLTSPCPCGWILRRRIGSLRHFDPLTQISREEFQCHVAARRRTGNFQKNAECGMQNEE